MDRFISCWFLYDRCCGALGARKRSDERREGSLRSALLVGVGAECPSSKARAEHLN
jgi:hypothetical protein